MNTKSNDKNEQHNRLLLESRTVINIRSLKNNYFLDALQSSSLDEYYVVFHSLVSRLIKYSKSCISVHDTNTVEKGLERNEDIYSALDSFERRIYEDFNFSLNFYYKAEFDVLNPTCNSYCGYPDVQFFKGWRPHTTYFRHADPLTIARKKPKT